MKTHTKTALLLVTFLIGLVSPSALAQDSAQEQSPELAVLNRFVGDWNTKTVGETSEGERTVIEIERSVIWVLGDTYVEDRVDGGGLPSFFGLWTYNTDEEDYRAWYFVQGSNKPIILTVKWDADAQAFEGAGYTNAEGNVLTTKHTFVGDDEYVLTGTIRDRDGTLLIAFTETNTRKK